MPLQLTSIVIDCHDPEKLAEFWSAAIGYTNAGIVEQYAMLRDPEKKGPNLLLQKVDEPKPGKNRMHWDWMAASKEEHAAEIERLLSLGATKVADKAEMGISWAVLADPEGNEFCVAVH